MPTKVYITQASKHTFLALHGTNITILNFDIQDSKQLIPITELLTQHLIKDVAYIISTYITTDTMQLEVRSITYAYNYVVHIPPTHQVIIRTTLSTRNQVCRVYIEHNEIAEHSTLNNNIAYDYMKRHYGYQFGAYDESCVACVHGEWRYKPTYTTSRYYVFEVSDSRKFGVLTSALHIITTLCKKRTILYNQTRKLMTQH